MKPGILAIDVGGTGLKAAVIDDRGQLRSDRQRVPTPQQFDVITIQLALVEDCHAHPL